MSACLTLTSPNVGEPMQHVGRPDQVSRGHHVNRLLADGVRGVALITDEDLSLGLRMQAHALSRCFSTRMKERWCRESRPRTQPCARTAGARQRCGQPTARFRVYAAGRCTVWECPVANAKVLDLDQRRSRRAVTRRQAKRSSRSTTSTGAVSPPPTCNKRSRRSTRQGGSGKRHSASRSTSLPERVFQKGFRYPSR